MSYVNPIWLEHQRKRYTRADAYRLAPPGSPEAKPPGWLDPSATRVRLKEAQEEEARARAAAEQDEYERELLQLRWEVKKLKLDHELWCLEEKYSPSQPRVPAGSPDGGQWTNGDGGGAANEADSLEQGPTLPPTAPDQLPRDDLGRLQAIANDPAIRSQINEAWNASNPPSRQPQEHGFWIARNESSGELFTRPFANPGSTRQITPGATPDDAIAFFHTHPNRPDARFTPGPSRGDQLFAADAGLPGIIQSHNGIYYFGPALRPLRGR